ncbi:hypothetical protein PILCRDRAFT_819211 [Piloderma croceum F 1598]|uniref:Uncharacterized protein n=1 Tax=Piloderma croceum (strain F 1598) TaxID=765440 RepID=A0A0C3FGW4_PILCF|nr:hypothetical protein PILCRDRAFT_819211 [Piloderma croceum F 1598]
MFNVTRKLFRSPRSVRQENEKRPSVAHIMERNNAITHNRQTRPGVECSVAYPRRTASKIWPFDRGTGGQLTRPRYEFEHGV